jgi:hypothetical protein
LICRQMRQATGAEEMFLAVCATVLNESRPIALIYSTKASAIIFFFFVFALHRVRGIRHVRHAAE